MMEVDFQTQLRAVAHKAGAALMKIGTFIPILHISISLKDPSFLNTKNPLPSPRIPCLISLKWLCIAGSAKIISLRMSFSWNALARVFLRRLVLLRLHSTVILPSFEMIKSSCGFAHLSLAQISASLSLSFPSPQNLFAWNLTKLFQHCETCLSRNQSSNPTLTLGTWHKFQTMLPARSVLSEIECFAKSICGATSSQHGLSWPHWEQFPFFSPQGAYSICIMSILLMKSIPSPSLFCNLITPDQVDQKDQPKISQSFQSETRDSVHAERFPLSFLYSSFLTCRLVLLDPRPCPFFISQSSWIFEGVLRSEWRVSFQLSCMDFCAGVLKTSKLLLICRFGLHLISLNSFITGAVTALSECGKFIKNTMLSTIPPLLPYLSIHFSKPFSFQVIADDWIDQLARASPLLVFPLIMPVNMDMYENLSLLLSHCRLFFTYAAFFYGYGIFLHFGHEVDYPDAHHPVLNTSYQHYFHHARSIKNKPYYTGFMFKLWDQLFGMLFFPALMFIGRFDHQVLFMKGIAFVPSANLDEESERKVPHLGFLA